MEEFGESVEELKEKLVQYRVQLNAVENIIQEHHEEASLLKLQSDLKEVILLTENLIEFNDANEVDEAALLEGGTVDQKSLLTTVHPPKNANLLAASFDSSKVDARALKLQTLIGRTCQAVYEGDLYYAEIIRIEKDPTLGECAVVEFVGYGNRESYPLTQIQLLPFSPSNLCIPGAKAQSIYSEDGKWYTCQIIESTPTGCKVAYTDFGNIEEVPFDRIRLVSGSQRENKAKVKEVVTPGGYRIPEYLQIKSTDTDAQKLSKRKRIQLLKKKQRVEQLDEAANTRATRWRKFNTKAVNKKISGYITGRGHQSIFKSVDEAAAQPLASASSAFIPRRKHDFEECLED